MPRTLDEMQSALTPKDPNYHEVACGFCPRSFRTRRDTDPPSRDGKAQCPECSELEAWNIIEQTPPGHSRGRAPTGFEADLLVGEPMVGSHFSDPEVMRRMNLARTTGHRIASRLFRQAAVAAASSQVELIRNLADLFEAQGIGDLADELRELLESK